MVKRGSGSNGAVYFTYHHRLRLACLQNLGKEKTNRAALDAVHIARSRAGCSATGLGGGLIVNDGAQLAHIRLRHQISRKVGRAKDARLIFQRRGPCRAARIVLVKCRTADIHAARRGGTFGQKPRRVAHHPRPGKDLHRCRHRIDAGKRCHCEDHEQFRNHLANFISAYAFGRSLKTFKDLTPYAFICKQWTITPEGFTLNSIHQMPGLNALCAGGFTAKELTKTLPDLERFICRVACFSRAGPKRKTMRSSMHLREKRAVFDILRFTKSLNNPANIQQNHGLPPNCRQLFCN